MNSMKKLFWLPGVAALILTASCNPDLNITNPNNPDVERALASGADVKTIAVSTVNSWYRGSTYYEGLIMLCVTADSCTANFGNFGMRFNNLEPRIPFENNSAGGDIQAVNQPWQRNYATLGAANDALRAIAVGVKIPATATTTDVVETAKYKSLAQFTQAATFTNLALMYNQAFDVDETFKLVDGAPVLKTYKEMSATALAKWDAMIAATTPQNQTYTQAELPLVGNLTSSRLARMGNTMAAALLTFTPRTAAEAATVDWNKVAAYADKGIGTGSAGAPFDFTVSGDNQTWYSYLVYYGDAHSWVRVDQRLINRMDPSIPAKFNGTVVPRGTSPDARYLTDYSVQLPVIGDPLRGIYMQSPFFHSRYVAHALTSTTAARTPVPYMLAAESDLIRAEALIRKSSPDLATAATLINITRVGRGKLPAATAGEGATALLGYIDYERDVELLMTNGWELYRARHIDRLQPGTFRHLPIPATELETLGLPIYTFGGPGKEM